MQTKHNQAQGSLATEENPKLAKGGAEIKPQVAGAKPQASETKPQNADGKPQNADNKPQAAATKDDDQAGKAAKAASLPGEEHKQLAMGVGTWKGKQTTWMKEGAEPVSSDCTYTISPIMDGRFFKAEASGRLPDSGVYEGLGYTGFDNTSKKFVGTWMNSSGTGIMNGSGDRGADGKSLTMTYTVNCPVAKKPVSLRKVETYTGPDAWTMEMFCADSKTGAEFKTMRIEFARKS